MYAPLSIIAFILTSFFKFYFHLHFPSLFYVAFYYYYTFVSVVA